jgi:BASS family bile acid:Na+ symporter
MTHLMKIINGIAQFVNKYLIYIMVLLMFISYFFPQPFLWIPNQTTTLLSIIMFCMGMTLNFTAFKMVALQPKAFIIGLLIQFTVSPLVAYGLARLFGLSSGLIIGFVLLGSVSGGTASNVMTFIGKGDVALTVSLTTVSTLLATVVTPFLVYILAGQYTEISFLAMLLSVLQMVLLPIVLGVIVHKLIANYIEAWMQSFVLVSSVSILLIVAGTVAKNGAVIVQSGAIVILLVLLHNLIGYGAGYGISRMLGVSDQQAKSVMFQLGMKNTGLAISLATAHFATIAAAVTPAAVGMVIHQITGPILANLVAKKGETHESKHFSTKLYNRNKRLRKNQ